MHQIHIDSEFKALIPPLQPEEFAQLEANILADGCRDPLVVWGGTLVDGHNRYEICTKHSLPFDSIEIDFDDRSYAVEWIIKNQFGRRNLLPYVRTQLALRLEGVFSGRAKANQIRKPASSVLEISTKQELAVDTRKEIAKIAGVSDNTVAKVKKIESLATPEVKAALATGEISINQAHKEIVNQEKREVRAELIQKQRDDIEQGAVALPVGVFEVIAIDPPWNYGREYDPEGSRVANPYPEMTQAQLLELEPPFANDAVLFLWTTHQFMWDAKELMDKWGFTYKATMVWDKERIGMGAWVRMQCEFCLIGIKGKPTWDNTTWRDIIRESRREHSRKPDAFYKMVEEVTVGRRLEYFSREQRKGWEVFGNDVEKF